MGTRAIKTAGQYSERSVVFAMPEQVGILVDRLTLHRAMHGGSTHEQISLYREVALAEGIDIILFSIDQISLRRNQLHGYVPSSQGWQRVSAPIPKVIHKRVLYLSDAPLKILARLHRRGIILVNPYLMQNKIKMYQILSQEPSIRAHIPLTRRYRWYYLKQRLDSGHNVILKPVIGSVGRGILRIIPLPGDRAQITGQSTSILSRSNMRRRLRARLCSDHYFMQQYLDLARYKGNLFDLRVPVQRDGKGEWTVPGMVAKVAVSHPFLTNLAQGGHAVPGEIVLDAAFPPSIAATVQQEIRRLAIEVAQIVAREYPYAADLGLDIGIDAAGKPWLIEVNSRDQRITFHEAGMHEAFRTLYKNPLAYCVYLIKTRRST